MQATCSSALQGLMSLLLSELAARSASFSSVPWHGLVEVLQLCLPLDSPLVPFLLSRR